MVENVKRINFKILRKWCQISCEVYREFSPYANFITANFVTAVFQNYIKNFANAIFCDHKINIWLMLFFANANFG